MTLKVGIIGCGGIARGHLSGWLELGGRAKVVGLCDVNKDNLAWYTQQVPEAEVYDDFEKMIRQMDLDAVDICLPHHLHLPAIMAAIDKKVHWLCEKPLCMTLEEADQIESAMAKNPDVIGMSAHNQVFMPSLQEARRLIETGYIGEPYLYISQDCFIIGLPPAGSLIGTPPRSPVAEGTWRANKQTMGGGELIDTGYHPSYRLLFLAGSEPQVITAVTGRYRNKHMQAEDTATVLIRFEDGTTGLIRTSWAMALPSGHWPFHVIGSMGELYGSGDTLWLKPTRFAEPAKITFRPVHGIHAEVQHFVECIEQKKTPIQSHIDGIRVLRVIRKAYDFVEANNAGV